MTQDLIEMLKDYYKKEYIENDEIEERINIRYVEKMLIVEIYELLKRLLTKRDDNCSNGSDNAYPGDNHSEDT